MADCSRHISVSKSQSLIFLISVFLQNLINTIVFELLSKFREDCKGQKKSYVWLYVFTSFCPLGVVKRKILSDDQQLTTTTTTSLKVSSSETSSGVVSYTINFHFNPLTCFCSFIRELHKNVYLIDVYNFTSQYIMFYLSSIIYFILLCT